MIRPVATSLASLLSLVLFWAANARAEDEVLKLVPEGALGFAFVNRPADADAKLQQLGRQMNLPIPSLLTKLQGPGGIREGIDKNRPMAALVLPTKEKEILTLIALIPVSDYAKFLGQFKSEGTEAGVTKIELWGDSCLVRSVGGYAAIARAPYREILEKGLKPAGEIPAALRPWQAWLAQKDAAVVMLAPGIRLLSAKVQQWIAGIRPALAQAGGQMKQAAAGLDMYVMLFQAAEKEVASIGFGVQRDAQGVIRLTKRARLVPGGDWAGFFAELKPAKDKVLAGLPNEPFLFAGGGAVSKAMLGKMMQASFHLIHNLRELYGLSEEDAKSLAELGKEKFPGVRGVSFVVGVAPSGESIISRTLGIMRVNSSETFVSDYQKYLARYSRIAEKTKSPMFQPAQVEQTEIGGTHALRVTMALPQMPNMPAESTKMVERMYGPGGKIVAWVVPCDEQTVVFSYMGEERLSPVIAAVKQGKPGLAEDAGIAKVVVLLPSDVTWSGFVSPKGVFDSLRGLMAFMLPPGTAPKIPEFASTPPIAVGLTTAPDEVEAHVVVPAEVIEAIGRLAGGNRQREVPAPEKVEER
jgi:hypothetical protein